MHDGPTVFISYKRDHAPTLALVEELEAALAKQGIRVLRDIDIEPGDHWPARLWHWLMECTAAVVLVSDDAARSDWCRREWSVLAARSSHAGLPVIPLHTGGISPGANILDQLQAVVVKDGDTATAVATVVGRLEVLRPTPPTADDWLAAHRAWLQWQFADAPALGKDSFSLADAYIDTECGVMTWADLGQDRSLDPFSEATGRRVDLVDAALARFRDPNFRDLVVVQGPAGSGKSAFSLRLATRLIDEGFHPVLVRFRDLRLSSYAAADELLQDAVRIAPSGEHPPAPADPLFARERLNETIEIGRDTNRSRISRTVLILDGWDEVALTGSVRFKQQVDEWLPRLRERFLGGTGPPVRVLLTGRPSALVDRSGLLRRETAVLTIRPLRPEQVRRYAAQIAARLDGAGWHLDLDRCERAFTRYEATFGNGRPNDTDVLGLPLLALLAFRTIAEWNGDVDELFAQPTALYSALINLTTEHAGKAEPGPEGTVHRGGWTLRRLLQRVASIITTSGAESVSFGELERRLEDDDALLEWAQHATDGNTLHELVVNFYFKSHAELGCEFLHKSFREYLFAEAVVAAMEAATADGVGPYKAPVREWGADFGRGSIHHDLSRSLASLLGPQWLTPEVRNHLFWLIERAATGPQRSRWVWIRDLLIDIWTWWAEGAHLRVHLQRRNGHDDRLPPAVVDTLHDASPAERRDWSYSPSTATIDAHLGDALLHVTAFVHEQVADEPTTEERQCQAWEPGRVWFRPFRPVDAGSVLGRLAGTRGRPDGLGLSRARLRAVDLSGEDLTGCVLAEIDLRDARLGKLHAPWVVANDADLADAQLDHAVLHQSRLRGAKLGGASLVGVLLTEAHLVGARLANADLRRADLTDANLRGAYLRGANLRGANLHRINLCEAHLGDADLTGANLTDAQLVRANLTGTKFETAYLGGANLTGAHLTGADLRGAHLADVNLRGAHLAGADLRGAHLTGANLTGAHLTGADLGGAHLAGADLTGADIEGAGLGEADLANARRSLAGPEAVVAVNGCPGGAGARREEHLCPRCDEGADEDRLPRSTW